VAMATRNLYKGFTYIELVLALTIIACIVLAFTHLFLNTSISVTSAQYETLACNFAGDKMEEIKNESFDGIGSPWYPNAWETETETLSGKTFTRTVTISQLETSLKRVDIGVTWSEGGESKNIDISSLIVDRW